MTNWKQDANTYAKMSVPHESPEIANEKIAAFLEAVSKARKEFNISDVLIAVRDSAVYEGGEVGEFITSTQIGNQLYGEPMAAYLYGKMQAERREMIAKIAGGNSK